MKKMFLMMLAVPSLLSSLAFAVPLSVDLRPNQTAIRNQGGRTTCITFAAAAAMEAAYKRAGYGDLDFSEQFINHMGKTFWLHPHWSDIAAKGEDGSEGQVGAFGGGGGVGYVIQMSRGFMTPLESVMPYRATDYTAADFAGLANAWDSAYWNKQRRMSDFNLDPRFLPTAALKANQYYSVRSVTAISDPRNTATLEAVLASGKEVVWDHMVANTDGEMWTSCRPGQASCPRGAHSMILVGYNRTHADPNKHYFIGKNSWGPSGHAGSGGFTYLSYDFVRRNGINANYITAINPPRPWLDLSFIGRWGLVFDGHRGQLDFYHLPGQSTAIWEGYGVTTADRRLGAFYNPAGRAYKVNGRTIGQQVLFRLDDANPNARWDELGGREFSYIMAKYSALDIMAGFHRDLDGSTYAGYAVRGSSIIPAGVSTPRPFGLTSFQNSRWMMYHGPGSHVLNIGVRNDALLTAEERTKFFAYAGTIVAAGTTHNAVILQSKTNMALLNVRSLSLFGEPAWGNGMFIQHLNHVAGNMAGHIFYGAGTQHGVVLVRQ